MKKELKVEILAVGDEVISGKVINTNASFLSLEFSKIGLKIVRSVVVPDSVIELKNEVNYFLKSDIDILVTTGGLGPTHDDFTKEVVFESMNIKLVQRQEAVNLLKEYFRCDYPECNLKQTYYPLDAILLPNKLGTAMGCVGKWNNKYVSTLVGPQTELKPMVIDYLIPYFKKLTNNLKTVKEYIVMGTGESKVEELLKDYYLEYSDIETNPYFSIGLIRYELRGFTSNIERFNQATHAFEKIMDKYIVTTDPNIKIEDLVYNELRRLNYHITFSESCTGGMLASKLINTSGASNVIDESFITYADKAKIFTLGVNPEVIKKYDVVSREVTEEMVIGLYNKTKCDVCVSVSGYAGPTGGTDEIPVGTVWFSIKIKDDIYSEKCFYKTSRNILREKITMYIYYHLYRLLKAK